MNRSWSPWIPDLRPSADAVIDERGRVRCISCKCSLPFTDAEIVGLGWRCRACATRAALAGSDEDAHLLPDERAQIRREPSPRAYALAGAALLVVAIVMWVARWDVVWRGAYGPRSLFVYVCVLAVGLLGCGWFRWLDR